MYSQQPWPSQHMDYGTYLDLCMDEVAGVPAIVVERSTDGYQVGWLAYTVGLDMHFPGKGAIVYHLVVDKHHPEALRVLMKQFHRILRDEGCEWYQTTRRVNETTLESTFKRL